MNDKEKQMSIMYSFRYALGRRSTAPSDVSEMIKNNHNLLDYWAKQQIVEEIDRAILMGQAGFKCDISIWESLKEFLKGVINE